MVSCKVTVFAKAQTGKDAARHNIGRAFLSDEPEGISLRIKKRQPFLYDR